MALKKINESIVQDIICELKQDKVFVEWAKNNKDIKGFKFNDVDFAILKQTHFTVYPDNYTIKFDWFKHRNLAGVKELYEIAKAKLDEPDYNDKMNKYKEELKKVLDRRWNKDEDAPMPAWGVPSLGR